MHPNCIRTKQKIKHMFFQHVDQRTNQLPHHLLRVMVRLMKPTINRNLTIMLPSCLHQSIEIIIMLLYHHLDKIRQKLTRKNRKYSPKNSKLISFIEHFCLVIRNPVHHCAMVYNLIVQNPNLFIYQIRPLHLKVLSFVYVHRILPLLIIEILVVVPIHPHKQHRLNMSINLPIFSQRISLILHH